MAENLYDFYITKVTPQLKRKFAYAQEGQVPRIKKIVLHQSCSSQGGSDSKGFATALKELSLITGQKGTITRAKKSIAGFQIREGDPLGIKITLRRKRMYAFLSRLIHLSLPRLRDFRGLSPLCFDQSGNYTFGIDDPLMFPELSPEKIQKIRGLQISIRTTAKTDLEAYFLFKELGIPLQKHEFWESFLTRY